MRREAFMGLKQTSALPSLVKFYRSILLFANTMFGKQLGMKLRNPIGYHKIRQRNFFTTP